MPYTKEEYRAYLKKWREEHKGYFAKWYQDNKEHVKECSRKWREEHKGYYATWYENNKEHRKEYFLKRTYNLTMEEYNQLLENQNNKCRICDENLRRPHVDHDHSNGKIRGILCHTCNSGLGLLRDSRELLCNAITYLDKSY